MAKIFQFWLRECLEQFKNDRVVEYGNLVYTYSDIDRNSNTIASLLIHNGIQKESFIGIYTSNRVRLIESIIGILKAGCVFIPLDPALPSERLSVMIDTADIQYILYDEALDTTFKSDNHLKDKNVDYISLDSIFSNTLHPSIPEFPTIEYTPEDKIYVYFTSGTTGKPKAIVGKNKSLMHFIDWEIKTFSIKPGFRISQWVAIGFDALLRDIFVTLCSGGVLCIPGNHEILANPDQLISWTNQNHINLIHCVPSVFKQLVSDSLTPSHFSSLQYIMMSGERIPHSLLEKWFGIFDERIQLVNYYGPTETTMIKTYHLIRKSDLELERIPVGKPMDGARVIILDEEMKVCDELVTGEIYIRTPFRTHGYYKEEALNREKFIQNPFNNDPNDLIFKTGDIGRFLSDGTIDFLGRKDRQVKVRGIRVELEDIENTIVTHPFISQAIVLMKEISTNDEFLCAYITLNGDLSESKPQREIFKELREYTGGKLPDYMIPSYWMVLEQFPLLPNGKIDMRSLPEPEIGKSNLASIPPRNSRDRKLISIWSEVLGIEKDNIGIDDNFFQLGGHSLKATLLMSRIHRDMEVRIPLSVMLMEPTVRKLSDFVIEAQREAFVPIEPIEEKEYYSLSPAQKRLYVLQHIVPGSTGYNMPYVLPAANESEKIDINKLEAIFKTLIARHESFRTSFITVNEEPFQVIHQDVPFSIECVDASGIRLEDIASMFCKPFDLSIAPLLRVNLINLDQNRQVLFIDMHHIISDARSQIILENEFRGLFINPSHELSPVLVQYKDYSEWIKSGEQRQQIDRQKDYWMDALSGEIPVLTLPTDYARQAIQSTEGNVVQFGLTPEEVLNLKTTASENDTTLYVVLLALFNILFARLAHQEDIIIGTPVESRRHPDLENVIGMMVNTLAMRNYPLASLSLIEFLENVRRSSAQAFENQEYPFEELVEHLALERDTARNPLFDVMLNVLNSSETGGNVSQEEIVPDRHEVRTSRFDMTWSAFERAEYITFSLEYSTALFLPSTIDRFISYLKYLISQLPAIQNTRLSQIDIIPVEEREKILEYCFGPGTELTDKSVDYLFEQQVERVPNRIAVVYREMQLSYKEYGDRSSQLADQLRASGVEPGDVVAIRMERSIEWLIAVIAILKARGVYLPIDHGLPEERVHFMLKDSGAGYLLSLTEHTEGTKEKRASFEFWVLGFGLKEKEHRIDIPLDKSFYPAFFSLNRSSLPTFFQESRAAGGSSLNFHTSPFTLHPSYIIYTSGTTGKPKGVLVGHQALVNLCSWHKRFYELTEKDRTTQIANIGFDASVWETFPYLATGVPIHIIEDSIKPDAQAVKDFFIKNCITIGFLPTQLCEQFMEIDEKGDSQISISLRALLTGGDKLNRFAPRKYKLYNNYGPTENTVVSTSCEVTAYSTNISIGKPVDNTGIFILDTNYRLQPIGVPGELCISGGSLAHGYLNRPEMTAEKFIPLTNLLGLLDLFDLFKKSNLKLKTQNSKLSLFSVTSVSSVAKLYLTGDLTRWLPGGNIEFLGRIDSQVKVRGFRIELGEIESRLLFHECVKDAVVTARNHSFGDNYLCAYIISRSKDQDEESLIKELKEYLLQFMPAYMIPTYFVFLESFPLNRSGKVDRNNLPEPLFKTVPGGYIAPRNEIEKKLIVLWKDLLGLSSETSIGIDDNFFEIGGHSLKATVLVSRIHKLFDVLLPLTVVFQNPTIRRLSETINASMKKAHTSILPCEKKEYYPLSSAQERLYFMQQKDPDSTAYNTPFALIVEGSLDTLLLESAVKEMIRRHSAFRTSFPVVGDEVVQRIHDAGDTSFSIEYPGEMKGMVRSFDLNEPPLMRIGLIKNNDNEHVLMMDMHHIITDGISMTVFFNELIELYRGSKLPPLELQYVDFSQWMKTPAQIEFAAKQEAFWLNEFAGEIPVLAIQTDYSRPMLQRFEGKHVKFEIDEIRTGRLKALVLEEGCTLYITLLAIYNILLSKLSGGEDIIVGTTTNGRRHSDLENIIGMFVNTLALRNFPAQSKSFREFLREVAERTIQAFENQDYQFDNLVEKLGIQRIPGRNPLFDITFEMNNIDFSNIKLPQFPHLSFKPYSLSFTPAKFDLSFTAIEMEDKINIDILYNKSLFTPQTIEKYMSYFKKIMDYCLETPDGELSGIQLISETLQKNVRAQFNESLEDE